jgi:hypothetical protein
MGRDFVSQLIVTGTKDGTRILIFSIVFCLAFVLPLLRRLK